MLTIEPGMVSIFWGCSPISCKPLSFVVPVLRSTPNHIPLKYRCPDYCCIRFRHVYFKSVLKVAAIMVLKFGVVLWDDVSTGEQISLHMFKAEFHYFAVLSGSSSCFG